MALRETMGSGKWFFALLLFNRETLLIRLMNQCVNFVNLATPLCSNRKMTERISCWRWCLFAAKFGL